jgi:hypothetical protein
MVVVAPQAAAASVAAPPPPPAPERRALKRSVVTTSDGAQSPTHLLAAAASSALLLFGDTAAGGSDEEQLQDSLDGVWPDTQWRVDAAGGPTSHDATPAAATAAAAAAAYGFGGEHATEGSCDAQHAPRAHVERRLVDEKDLAAQVAAQMMRHRNKRLRRG